MCAVCSGERRPVRPRLSVSHEHTLRLAMQYLSLSSPSQANVLLEEGKQHDGGVGVGRGATLSMATSKPGLNVHHPKVYQERLHLQSVVFTRTVAAWHLTSREAA